MVLLAVLVAVSGIAPPFIWTSTQYAPGYSEKQFQNIQVGAPEHQVREALGDPLWAFTNGPYGQMLYTLHGGGSIYFHRRLLVMSNGVVAEKISFIDYD